MRYKTADRHDILQIINSIFTAQNIILINCEIRMLMLELLYIKNMFVLFIIIINNIL